MNSIELIEMTGHWVLPLNDCQVGQCCVDFAVTLLLGDPDQPFQLTLEQPSGCASLANRQS